jgi:hypothetical protein
MRRRIVAAFDRLADRLEHLPGAGQIGRILAEFIDSFRSG